MIIHTLRISFFVIVNRGVIIIILLQNKKLNKINPFLILCFKSCMATFSLYNSIYNK